MTSLHDDSPAFALDVPSPARMYDYVLGGKDNFQVDRETVQAMASQFPDSLDATRTNRLFLYRVVRFLAREAGIRQYLDLGSGLPTQNNVHQVAQRFQPDARVVPDPVPGSGTPRRHTRRSRASDHAGRPAVRRAARMARTS